MGSSPERPRSTKSRSKTASPVSPPHGATTTTTTQPDVEQSAIPAAEGPVPADELEEADFDPDDGASSASTSITSSIYKHSFENGRRFHSYKYGRYPIPNDDMEQNREDVKHAMMLELTDGKLWYAPIPDDAQKVLDVGTGTGIWAIETAEQLPSAEVLGLDLSPIQPKWVPPNCRFMVDDVEEEWLNGDNYDLVHFRTMTSVLKDMAKVIQSAYDALKPGGWIEFQELQADLRCDDGTMPPDDGLAIFYHHVHASLTTLSGMDFSMPAKLRPLLEAAGFERVTHSLRKVPVGPWAADRTLRTAGLYAREAVLDLVPAMVAKPFPATGISAAEGEVIAVGARRALRDMSRHRYLPFHFWTAQKPY